VLCGCACHSNLDPYVWIVVVYSLHRVTNKKQPLFFLEKGPVRDSPKGPLKQPEESCLKPEKTKTKHIPIKHTHGARPTLRGPHAPPERPTQRPPREGSASLEGSHLPRAGSASLEGSWLPQAGSTSLEGSPPPRSRLMHTHVRSRTRVQTFNALTTAGRHHHAPETHAPALLHQLPRGTHPRYCGGLCDTAGVSPVTLRRLLPYG
jgi:hypothetical protein